VIVTRLSRRVNQVGVVRQSHGRWSRFLTQPYLRLAAAVVPLIVTTVTPASIT
jgi:hypothetical protein